MKKLVCSLLLCVAGSAFASNADSATNQLSAGLNALTASPAPAAAAPVSAPVTAPASAPAAISTPVTTSTSAVTSAAVSAPVQATDYQSTTTSTITIAPRDNLIVATAITNWDPKASDTLAIQWIAPKHGYCQDSTFNVTRGPNASHDAFWAYRTVVHTNSKGATVYCSGHWEAKVVNTVSNKVLATTGYDVTAPVATAPATTDTTVTTTTSVSVLGQ